VTKPRGAARTNASVATDWAGIFGPLDAVVVGALGFLERAHHFTFRRSLTPPECEWRWSDADADVAVVVASEYAGAPWVVIEQAGQRYPGVRAIELLAPGLRVPEVAERGPSLDEVRAVVEQYARVLRDHGRPLLEGEPGFFAWLRAAAATDGG